MKIVHLADLHLGYRAYYRIDKKGINIREKDLIKAFKEALDKIAIIKPDLIIMAGDIFHRPRPSNLTISHTILLLNQFRTSCNAPIVMIAGNHEAVKTTESGSVLRIIENSVPNVVVVDYNIENVTFKELDTAVLCIPHGGLSRLEEVSLKPDLDYKYNLMAIHGTYEHCKEIAGYSNGALVKESDLNPTEWDYIAFGHYHKYTKLADNTFYSGAIERTTSNVWQEADDPKGFIEYDLETKELKFHALESPRKVYDVKRVNASNLTSVEINLLIDKEIEKIKDFDKSIVRLTFENIDPVSVRELDYKKIREYKKQAVHFRLNLIKKDAQKTNDLNNDSSKTKTILDYLNEELENVEISHELDKEKFKTLARQFLVEESI